MAVRTTNASPHHGRFSEAGDDLRPEFDWVDVEEETRGDKTTWYYPMETGVVGHHPALLAPQVLRPQAGQLGLFGTLNRRDPVRLAGLRRAMTFTDLFYGRLQLNPSYLNLGNILNVQTREVELWNASFYPVTITGVLTEGADGASLSLPQELPITLAPLQALTLEVGASTTGPTVLDARFSFQATELPGVTLQVVGTRAVVFSIEPDTSKSYTEKLEWVTDVITSHDGTEQRITLNDWPDTQLTMSVYRQGAQAHFIDNLLWGWQHRVYALPLWHRHANLSAPAYVDTTSIPCSADYTGLKVDGLGILWHNFETFETFEVAAITAEGVTAKRPLQRSWGTGSIVAACRSARLPQEVETSWEHADLAQTQLTFIFTEVEQEEPFEFSSTYRDLPLMLIEPNWVSPMTERNVRNLDAFETDLRARFTVLKNDVPYVVRSHAWFLKGRAKIDQYRRWLFSRRGRAVPFWAPSWKNDFTLARRVEVGETVLAVRDVNYVGMYQTKTGRQDIIIFLRGRPPVLRRIVSAAEGSEGSGMEVFNLDQEITEVINPSDVRMICLLGLYRLDADSVELDWRSDQLALCSQNMRLLTDGV